MENFNDQKHWGNSSGTIALAILKNHKLDFCWQRQTEAS